METKLLLYHQHRISKCSCAVCSCTWNGTSSSSSCIISVEEQRKESHQNSVTLLNEISLSQKMKKIKSVDVVTMKWLFGFLPIISDRPRCASCIVDRSRLARPSIDYDGLQRICKTKSLVKWQLAEIKLTPLRKLYTRANYGQFMNILASSPFAYSTWKNCNHCRGFPNTTDGHSISTHLRAYKPCIADRKLTEMPPQS